MEIVQSLYDFFGLSALSESATFVDVVNILFEIGISLWITLFMIRCFFLAVTMPERRFF